ncbi:integrase catalytic domain-containing protein [Trichonephila clavipes]|nr:integrase catalytic domain-containing protein [Trichonephila clavipes]
MDPIDAFPEHLSTTVVPVTLPDKPDALEYAARQGQVRAGILYQEPTAKRVFVLFCKDHWHQKKTWLDNFKRAIMEAKHVNEFRPNDVMWEKTSKGLLRNPDRLLKNTDTRMVYIYNNLFFVKKDFTFGLRTVTSGEIHLIQTTHVPMFIYELSASSLKCRAHVIRRSFEPHDQMLYHRTILEPHTAYPIPAGTHYIVLTVQKTAFGLDIIPESLLPQLLQKGFHVGDFGK